MLDTKNPQKNLFNNFHIFKENLNYNLDIYQQQQFTLDSKKVYTILQYTKQIKNIFKIE